MNRLLQIAALLFLTALVAPAQVITMSVTVTNRAVTGDSFTANGSVRVFTNVTAALTVQTNLTSQYSTKTNLFNAIAAFPFTGVTLQDGVGAAAQSNFTLRARLGGALSGSITGSWGIVTLSTQTGPSTFTMLYPAANIVGETNKTNQSSDIVSALNTYPTNFFNTNAGPLSNFLSKGASPLQTVTAPVLFSGGLRASAAGAVALTNGFTSSITNINSVSSNHVNYGNALRSEGPGGNSLQLGSNAMALGARGLAIGNGSLSTNDEAIAIGTGAIATNGVAIGNGALAAAASSMAIGKATTARASQSFAAGFSALATGDNGMALGSGAISRDNGQSVGFGSEARSNNAVAIGLSAFAEGVNTMAVGTAASATHSNSAAIGPLDDGGTAVATTDTNQMRLGTARHRISVPGLYESPRATNSQFGGTNIARGSWSYPAFALTTLAAGNNISVPFGTNVFIRFGAGPASAATICGIIGAATSGGLDGQFVHGFNDTGFGLTFAVNTVDPVTRNRINTTLGTDVTIADQSWVTLCYDGTDERWKLTSPFSVTATATNAVSSIFTNGIVVSSAATNIDIVTGTNMAIRTTNTSGNVQIQINAIVNTNGSLPLPINNAKPALTNMPSFEGNYLADELLFPRTNAAGTDIALSANWSFAVPLDYATNTASLRMLWSITATNGPNASNHVWRASFLHSESATTTDLRVGSFGTAYLVTNTVAACFNCTNQLLISTISFTNASGLSPGGLGILKLERVSTVDTYVGASSLIGLQIDYGK